MKVINLVFLLLVATLLSACSSTTAPFGISNAGQARYHLTNCQEGTGGQPVCSEAEIFNTKDIANLEVTFSKDPQTGEVNLTLDETGAKASDPVAASVELINSQAEVTKANAEILRSILSAVKVPQ